MYLLSIYQLTIFKLTKNVWWHYKILNEISKDKHNVIMFLRIILKIKTVREKVISKGIFQGVKAFYIETEVANEGALWPMK